MNQDAEHLKVLSIFHYVMAGFFALLAIFPVIHLVLGIVMITAPEKLASGDNPPPAFVGWIFAGVAGVFIVMGALLALLSFLTGRYISKRMHHTFCLVMAGIECLMFPIGTVLGVFTFVVLSRESVKAVFRNRGVDGGLCAVQGASGPLAGHL